MIRKRLSGFPKRSCSTISGRHGSQNLSKPVAVAMRLGNLLDLPQHPDKSDPEPDDDAEKHESQSRRSERGQHGLLEMQGAYHRLMRIRPAPMQQTPGPSRSSRHPTADLIRNYSLAHLNG